MSSTPCRPRVRHGVTRYAFAWGYLICFGVTGVVFTALTPHGQAALTAWASTNVANLTRGRPARWCCPPSSRAGTTWSGWC